MRFRKLLPILAFWLLVPVGLANAAQEFSRHEISSETGMRSYLLRMPQVSTSSASIPLVVMLHGHGASAKELTGQGRDRVAPYRGWIVQADRAGLALVAPEGLPGPDGEQAWNDCRTDADNPASDDVAFLEKLIDTLARERGIDAKRVFVVGTSNGGHMALRMAMERPRHIAAAAAIVAAMPARSKCAAPTVFVPVLFMNGTADPLLPFEGGEVAQGRARRGITLSAHESVEVWRKLAGKLEAPQRVDYADTDSRDGSRVRLLRQVKDGIPALELFTIEGGGHAEPSRSERYARFFTRMVGPQNGDIEMAEEIWKFFSAQSAVASPAKARQ